MLYYVFTPSLDDPYTTDEQAAFWYLNNDNSSLSVINTYTDSTEDIDGLNISNLKILDLNEQQAVTGFYSNNEKEVTKTISSFKGFERFTELKDIFVNYSYYNTNYQGIQVNALDLSPLKDLALRQFYFITRTDYTSNDFLPLLSGSKDTLRGFAYGSYTTNPVLFDPNFLLGFTNLDFIYLHDYKPLSITSTDSFRSFSSYLYLFNKNLYDNTFITSELTRYNYVDFRYLFDTVSESFVYDDSHSYTPKYTSMLVNNIDISGSDIVNAEILNKLSINDIPINSTGYIDLSSVTSITLPTTVTLRGLEYNISFESLSAYISINANTLTIDASLNNPGYAYIKVILPVEDTGNNSKIISESERIILLKI